MNIISRDCLRSTPFFRRRAASSGTMTSILASQPVTFLPKNLVAQMDTPQMPPAPAHPADHQLKADTDAKSRGRRRSRNEGQEETGEASPGPEGEGEGEGEGDAVDGHSSGNDGPSRKRRRSRKGLDKKFECTKEGCGKSYSRAEHLSDPASPLR